MKPCHPALAVLVAASLAGCGWFGTKKPDYQGASARTAKPLEVPPELTTPTVDDRFAIPNPRAQTSFSDYSQRPGTPATGPAAPATPQVLPKIEGGRMERAGDQRWLVIKGDPAAVWPRVRDFWLETGFTLTRDNPEIGIMETDWHEDRAKIPQDFVRRTVGKVLDGMWSTPRRDKFRTRLEKGAEAGTTEVFVSNRQLEEVFTSQHQDTTKWVPRPADRELEAEMLQRILAKVDAAAADTRIASASPAPGTGQPTRVASAAPAVAESRNAALQNSGAGPLVVNDNFDRAWRRVGLALDRVGFTVEDRDRSKGLFFVRYIDPEADARTQAPKDQTWVDKLAFWRSTPKPSQQPQYRIHVGDAGGGMSHVEVQNAQGTKEESPTGKRILTLLYDQLK